MTAVLRAYETKTRILFANGGISALGETARQTGANKILVVADPGLESPGIIDAACKSLTSAGLEWKIFLDVEPEPYLDGADGAARVGRDAGADLVVGLGGGSAMDTAKAAAVLITNDGEAGSYVGLNKVELAGVTTIMVPTTAGTGSEVTFTAVFTDRETRAKGGINSPFLFPNVALLDPELTISLPPEMTAATGMDALTHAIESVTGRASTVFTEALALKAVSLIASNLRRTVFHGHDLHARENMLLGSVLAGMALADAGVGAAHALAYPLGGNYRIPHGLANAMLIPHVMRFNLPAAEHTLAMVARSMGERVDGCSERSAAAKAVEAVTNLCRDVGIPSKLSDIGVPRADIPMLVEGALKVSRPVENNPRALGEAQATWIYELAFGAQQ